MILDFSQKRLVRKRVRRHDFSSIYWTRLTAIANIGLVLCTVILLFINIFWLSIARKQLIASIEPNLQFSIHNDSLTLANSGLPDLINVTIEEQLYLFGLKQDIFWRSSPNCPMLEIGDLKAKSKVEIPLKSILHPEFFKMKSPGQTAYIALVVHFDRSIDRRKYLLVRTFTEGGENGFFPLFKVEGIGTNMPLPLSYEIINKIDTWERKLNELEEIHELHGFLN
ncbi:MAG: hypothetical protein V1681_06350 [Candidatus Neomarinimicrobiota bacterium]